MKNDEYYMGIDAGTSSVGWAVTTPDYQVVKKNGKALWGVRLFDEASTAEKRRMARSVRRNHGRKIVRQKLLRELFSKEISKIDPAFYLRLDESKFWEDDKTVVGKYCLFADKDFTDTTYHTRYPTIYHLRKELMTSSKPHDIRLVYLAIAHIVKHRGHFLAEMSESQDIPDFSQAWETLEEDAREIMGLSVSCVDQKCLKTILQGRMSITDKKKLLKGLIEASTESGENLGRQFTELLSGKECDIAKLFVVTLEEEDKDVLKVAFAKGDMDDEEKLSGYQAFLDDKFQILQDISTLYNWGVLVGILRGAGSISEAKVDAYEKHRADLAKLQRVVRRECPGEYGRVFRAVKKGLCNYSAYAGHDGRRRSLRKGGIFRCSFDDFAKYLKSTLGASTTPEAKDILAELEAGTFLPLQRGKPNAVIPYQMNLRELRGILDKAAAYLPFLNERDEGAISVREKIESLVTFRVPYYVGPLDNAHARSGSHWAVKKFPERRVFPWNFDVVVDKEASAKAFMDQLTGTCAYLLGEPVLPKDSIAYGHFMALNELNNVTVSGEKLPVCVKKRAFLELFLQRPTVTRKAFRAFLRKEGLLGQGDEDMVGGIDGDFKASLKVEIKLRAILAAKELSNPQIEEIILAVLLLKQEPQMLEHRIRAICPMIEDRQVRQIRKLPCSGWGRLSSRFLTGLKAEIPGLPGKKVDILDALMETQCNLMQLLSEQMPFYALIEDSNKSLFEGADLTYRTVERLPASPAIRRSIWQATRIIDEIIHIMGRPPAKIFVEMARGATGTGRTVSRKHKLDDCFQRLGREGVEWSRELESFEEPRLRQDKLFLYFTQMGRCLYSGERIDLGALLADTGNQIYDIDHIYPRSKVKDDSLDNRVLVLRKCNLEKGDHFPLDGRIREKQSSFWAHLNRIGLLSRVKFERLMRTTGFSDEELAGFISRQLVETRQSTKLLAELLSQALPDSRVVYVKAGNVSDFRQLFDLVKLRDLNDLHHAKDAYLNIVVGNVYDVKFTADPRRFLKSGETYSMKPEVLFGGKYPIKRGGVLAWNSGMLGAVVRNHGRNNVMVTRLPQRRTSGQNGGLYDQNPKSNGTIPLKGDCRFKKVERYGGYKGETGAYMILVEHGTKEQRIRSLEPVYLRFAGRIDKEQTWLETYCGEILHLENPRVVIPEIRFNTLMEINGFKFWLSGRSGKAQISGLQAFQLILPIKDELYLKKILKVCDRLKKAHGKLEISEQHDYVTAEKNLALYDRFLEKLQLRALATRPSSQASTLEKGRGDFIKLSLPNQCVMLANILNLFKGAGQAQLNAIGGSKQAGTILFSKNTKENFVIYYSSVTGFYSHRDRRLQG